MQEDGNVHKERALLDVIEVILDVFVNGQRSVDAQLP